MAQFGHTFCGKRHPFLWSSLSCLSGALCQFQVIDILKNGKIRNLLEWTSATLIFVAGGRGMTPLCFGKFGYFSAYLFRIHWYCQWRLLSLDRYQIPTLVDFCRKNPPEFINKTDQSSNSYEYGDIYICPSANTQQMHGRRSINIEILFLQRVTSRISLKLVKSLKRVGISL